MAFLLPLLAPALPWLVDEIGGLFNGEQQTGTLQEQDEGFSQDDYYDDGSSGGFSF